MANWTHFIRTDRGLGGMEAGYIRTQDQTIENTWKAKSALAIKPRFSPSSKQLGRPQGSMSRLTSWQRASQEQWSSWSDNKAPDGSKDPTNAPPAGACGQWRSWSVCRRSHQRWITAFVAKSRLWKEMLLEKQTWTTQKLLVDLPIYWIVTLYSFIVRKTDGRW